ncbi:amidohydrolase [Candidatus Chloroploca sp. Khr17]|uniref:amidohydrolase n=1 Tax=Candidatus Chloroploca sp. Khr17 TaxID=2496869 RepID=UPI00101D83A2|nr:amidohydrolase [Candidatus Chloroploca sp. Khr17]
MSLTATLLVRNARIATLDPARPYAEAMAVVGERIAWLGSDADAATWHGPATKVLDAEGRRILPGLIDSHFHLLSGALSLGQLALEDAADLEEVQARLRTAATPLPPDAWLIGRGWKYRLFAGGETIHRHLLDAVVPDRPVFLTAFDGHTAWANTRALQMAGMLHGAETGSDFSTVVLDDAGFATGELRENEAMTLVSRLLPPVTDATRLALLRQALRQLAALGLTAIHNMDGDEHQVRLLQHLIANDELSLRVLLPLSLSPGDDPGRIKQWAATTGQLHGPYLRTSAVKLFMDGVVESKTALLLAPYADGSGDLGVANYSFEEFVHLASTADALGLQVFVHAIGDAAVRQTLDGFAAIQHTNGRRDARHRIEHVELLDPADAPRFAELGVIAAIQPIHANFGLDPQNTWRRMSGPTRWPWGFAWRRLRDAGAHLALGSDWPVADASPLKGIHVALNREPLDHGLPNQRLTLDEALAGYTTWAAYAGHRDDDLGQLTPGYLADFIILDRDPYSLPVEELATIKVILTIVGGKIIFTAS